MESFSLWSPKDPTTDQWKTSVLLFLLHLHPWGFAVLWILLACILPLLHSCLWASLISEGKNKKLTKYVTPWHFIREKQMRGRGKGNNQYCWYTQENWEHKTKENSTLTSRSYHWLSQLWIRGRDKPATQLKPNSVKLFSFWCWWKQDKRTTLNTGTSSPLEYHERCWSWGQISCSCWHRLASVKAGWAWKQDFATHQNIKRLLSTMTFNPPASRILQGRTQTVYKPCHLVPRRRMKHSPPCTSLHTHKLFAHPLQPWRE